MKPELFDTISGRSREGYSGWTNAKAVPPPMNKKSLENWSKNDLEVPQIDQNAPLVVDRNQIYLDHKDNNPSQDAYLEALNKVEDVQQAGEERDRQIEEARQKVEQASLNKTLPAELYRAEPPVDADQTSKRIMSEFEDIAPNHNLNRQSFNYAGYKRHLEELNSKQPRLVLGELEKDDDTGVFRHDS